MEGIADFLVIGTGAYLGVVALLVLVVGGMLLGRLAEEEEAGKRFYWAEWPLPESDSHVTPPGEHKVPHAA